MRKGKHGKESWRRNYGGTAQQKPSERGYEGILQKNHSLEARGRHPDAPRSAQWDPGSTQKASRRHPGGPQETFRGSQKTPRDTHEAPRNQRVLGCNMCKNHNVLLSKSARPNALPAREQPDPHQVPRKSAKVSSRSGWAPPATLAPIQNTNHQNPHRISLFWK